MTQRILSGWGQYPKIETDLLQVHSQRKVAEMLSEPGEKSLIARGMGRSYGDSALAAQTLSTLHLNHLIDFNTDSGEIRCAAGVTLAELLEIFVPRGWFLPVTPGTKWVTVGGAIASDVHGKNHHLHGSFCDHVSQLKLALANGDIVTCSRTENAALFHATCGGMGLTGIILNATFQLIPIQSAMMAESSYKTANLAETLERFEEFEQATYSVAWIDCLSSGQKLGRSLLMLGEHLTQGDLQAHRSAKLKVPFNMPSPLLNRYSVQTFNTLYYHKQTRTHAQREVHYNPYFYPLDGLHDWNRLYGKNGFTQYQFVLPKAAGLEGMQAILQRIVASRRSSFLAVLKAFGKANDNLLSFPMEGYTLALDFKIDASLFAFLDELDRMVLDYGGRLYLTKDARMSEHTFKQSYPNWEAFAQLRAQTGADRCFHSLQSLRLGL